MKHKFILLMLILLIILSLSCGSGDDLSTRREQQAQMALDFLRANPTCGEVGCTNSGCWCIRWVDLPE